MARFILLLLLVIAGALVIALFFDRRGRRDAVIDRLRWAFLHGTPLAGYSRAAALKEFVHPGGLRFRAPGSWTVELADGDRAGPAGVADSGRRVAVEVLRLDRPATGGTESVVDALKSLAVDGERSIEVLRSGIVLMKTLEPAHDERGLLASYAWRLARPAPRGGVQIAVLRLRLPVAGAADVIAQSDLATLDREVREATFSEGPPSAPAAT
jgi:hypothetical protein